MLLNRKLYRMKGSHGGWRIKRVRANKQDITKKCCTFALPAQAALLLLVPPVAEVAQQAGRGVAGGGRVRGRGVFGRREAGPGAASALRGVVLKGGGAGHVASSSSPRPHLSLSLEGGYRDGEALQVGVSPVILNAVITNPLFLWTKN